MIPICLGFLHDELCEFLYAKIRCIIEYRHIKVRLSKENTHSEDYFRNGYKYIGADL